MTLTDATISPTSKPSTVAELASPLATDNYALIDEDTKRDVRRVILKAVATPGHQVPFVSREMPVPRGWGSGGLQISLSIVEPTDAVKVIDQGDDGAVSASNLRRLIRQTTGVEETCSAAEATLIQSRHRIPERPLRDDQVLVLQVAWAEALLAVERRLDEALRMHAEQDYALMWVSLYEEYVRAGTMGTTMQTTGYPVVVNGRYIMAPSPVPKWDVAKLDDAPHLTLFGAGRDRRLYAVPPHTRVEPLTFDDLEFTVEPVPGRCALCESDSTYLVEVTDPIGSGSRWICSDTDWCAQRRETGAVISAHRVRAPLPANGIASGVQAIAGPDQVSEFLEQFGRTNRPDFDGAALEARDLMIRYGSLTAAEEISFTVNPGEALGIVGESGSGKSTVLRCLTGDLPPDTGSVFLRSGDGLTDLYSLKPAQRRALRVGQLALVHQDPARGLDLSLSAGGNVAVPLAAAGIRSFHTIRATVRNLLQRVEIPEDRIDDPVSTFSGGMRQRVQIAKAIASAPSILLLDELTTGLDASVAAGVLDLIRGLIEELGLAAVVVSHDFAVVELLCRRSLVMHRGRIVESTLTDQLLEDPQHPYSQRLVAAARG